MAWGTKYKIQFEDFFYRDCVINILYENYSGEVTQLYAGHEPCTWSGPSSNREKTEWIKGQSLELNIINITFEQYTNDFKDYGNKDIACQFIRDGNTIFYGYYVPDELSEPYFPGPNVLHLTFTDGLGLLKQVKYLKSDGTVFYGKRSLMQIMYDCLNETGLLEEHMGYFREACVFYAEGASQTNSDSPLDQCYVDVEHFIADDEKITCYEILERILISQIARIEQCYGIWYITPINKLHVAHTSRLYSANGGTFNYVSNTLLDNYVEITNGRVPRNNLNCFIEKSQKRDIHKSYNNVTVNFELQKKDSINFIDEFLYFDNDVPINWIPGNQYSGQEVSNADTNNIKMISWIGDSVSNINDSLTYEISVALEYFYQQELNFNLEIKINGYISNADINWRVVLFILPNIYYSLKDDGTWIPGEYTNTYEYINEELGDFIKDISISVTSDPVPVTTTYRLFINIYRPVTNIIVTPSTYYKACKLSFSNTYDVVQENVEEKISINENNLKSKEVILKLASFPNIKNNDKIYFNGMYYIGGGKISKWNLKGKFADKKELYELIAEALTSLYDRDMWLLEGTMISTGILPATRIIDNYNNKTYMLAEFKADVRFCKFFVTLLEINETGAYLLKESGESGDSVVFIQTESAEDTIELE
jgi:hypothetical protein